MRKSSTASAAGLVAGVAAALVIGSAAAHHSFSAEFDSTKEVRATGDVTQLDWQNPHAWIHLDVTELCERTAGYRPAIHHSLYRNQS